MQAETAAEVITEAAEPAAEAPAEEPAETAEEAAPAEETTSAIETTAEANYADLLFDNSYVHTIDIAIAEEDWQDLLANPLDKTKYKVSVTIDGDTIDNVSFATKGNSSLLLVVQSGNFDRYSYKLNFGKFDKEQTWHGLDKLNLQNLFTDTSYMHDSLSYSLFNRMGMPAPLTSYAWLTVNGEDRGLYNAVEDVDKSFLARITDEKVNLYKPDVEELAPTDEISLVEGQNASQGQDPAGTDLVYSDDLPEHYEGIFRNNVVKDNDKVQADVIRALKGLSGAQEGPVPDRAALEECLDTDEIIRYFAVHNFLVNFDSYTGPMLHNYCLSVKDGKLGMLPWDYNLFFGAFPSDGTLGRANDASDLDINALGSIVKMLPAGAQ